MADAPKTQDQTSRSGDATLAASQQAQAPSAPAQPKETVVFRDFASI